MPAESTPPRHNIHTTSPGAQEEHEEVCPHPLAQTIQGKAREHQTKPAAADTTRMKGPRVD